MCMKLLLHVVATHGRVLWPYAQVIANIVCALIAPVADTHRHLPSRYYTALCTQGPDC